MSVKSFASELRSTISELLQNGQKHIDCRDLISYLDKVIQSPNHDPSRSDVEHYKAQLQQHHEIFRQRHEWDMEGFRATITAGQYAIRTSLLLNGGSAVAVLAFVGHLAAVRAEQVPAFGECIMPFAYGALAATVTAGGTYIGQLLFQSEFKGSRKAGYAVQYFCILAGIASYGFFFWGLLAARSAFNLFAV